MPFHMGGQAISYIQPPMFMEVHVVAELDGVFEVVVSVPMQLSDVPPVSVDPDGKRSYRLVLELDGSTVYNGVHNEQSVPRIRFTYKSSERAILVGRIIDGDGNESIEDDCRYEIRYIPIGFAVSFETCLNALVSDSVIEGDIGGIRVKQSSLSILDSEIILSVDDNFINKDDGSQVYEPNPKHTKRS